MARNFTKDPQAVLDYQFNWRNWLADGEIISTYGIGISGAGLTVSSDALVDGAVTVWLAGGAVGINYVVACLVTTNLGRTDRRTIGIKVSDR